MQEIGKDLWIVRRDFKLPAFGNIGGCATIIRYATRELMIVSPVEFTREEIDAIKALGEVRYLVSPNPLHHLYLRPAQEAFSGSKLAGPRATVRKRANLKFDVILREGEPYPWAETVRTFRVGAKSPMREEFDFFHVPSKTFVVTDLLFNVQNPGSKWNHFWMWVNGADRRLTMSRMSKMVFDKKEARSVLAEVLKLGPQNLVVAHGEPIVGGAAEKLNNPF